MDPLSIAAVGWSITAVGWLMSALVSKAVNALLEAWAKRIGLGKEFETLKDQLLQLDALLTSAEVLRTNNSPLKKLVQNLPQLMYQAENLLDEMDYYRLEHEIQQRDVSSSSDASSSSGFRFTSRSILSNLKGMSCRSAKDALVPLPKTFSSRNLSQRMKELAKKLQSSKKDVRNAVQTELGVIITQNTDRSQIEATELRQTTSYHTEHEVVGRIQERDQLMNLLKNEKSPTDGKVPIVAIVGSGGVGKTTLAKLVFHDPEVCSHFQVRIWIYVSIRFDSDRLTREMLDVACGKRYHECCNPTELQNKLKDGLVSKRFLLVLDDMWEDKNKSQWDSMVAPLNDGMVKGSIILVTSRNKCVAEMVNARDIIYLKGLGKDAFLPFLSTCIFDNDQNYGGEERLRKIGEQIADKLEGNPLAAKTVGTMLKNKKHEVKYWIQIRDREGWISQSGPDDIMSQISVSYKHMPIHLQMCFSYCAMLPEDHTFTCEELVYHWMAQGFLDVRCEDKTMEDIGSDYFNELLNRGFFQSKPSAYSGLVCYTFHDHLLHHLARKVSVEECLRINDTEPIIKEIPPTIRHLSIFNCRRRDNEQICSALAGLERKNLSTMVNWDKLPSGTFRYIWDLLRETQYLRAMIITLHSHVQRENLKFQNFVSLRYLRLIMLNNTCKTLPKEICRLYHLEVFEIEAKLQELPNNFSNLVSLRHFIVEGELHSKICGVGKLTSLQGLNYFDVQQKNGFEIEQLGPLRDIGGSLHISNLENVKSKTEASRARLAEKENIDGLYLKWNYGEQENDNVLDGLIPYTNLKSLGIIGYGGVAHPSWLEPSSFIFLESLTLEDCKAWEVLPPIGEFEFLKHLKLSRLVVKEIGSHCYGIRQNIKFPSLEKLEIIDMPYLEKWVWNDQLQQSLCFKKLKELTIQLCTLLADLPLLECNTSEVLERFPSLESLKIDDCPQIFKLSPLPYSSLLTVISIKRTGFIKSMDYQQGRQYLSLILDQNSSHEVGEPLAFNKLSSLHYLEIAHISSLESLDLHSFVVLEKLNITGCQSLNSITFGEHLVSLRRLEIISCKTLSTMQCLKSLVYVEELHFRDCPGFIAACDSASKEIQRTKSDFSLSLRRIYGDSLTLLTLPICNQLTFLQILELEFFAFTEEHEISLQLLTSINLVDIRSCKNLQTFPFDLFPSLEELRIKFPRIKSLSTKIHTKITEECLKLRNIKEVHINRLPVKTK